MIIVLTVLGILLLFILWCFLKMASICSQEEERINEKQSN